MSRRETGGTAFPKGTDSTRGMSLRDYMAGQALAGYTSGVILFDEEAAQRMAKQCYMIADAMLRERLETEE